MPNQPFDLNRQELELARRQPESFSVADCAATVDDQQQRVFAVQQLVHQLMNAAGIAADCLSQCHESQVRSGWSPALAAAGGGAERARDDGRPRSAASDLAATLCCVAREASCAHERRKAS
jgi:hypothetical protein